MISFYCTVTDQDIVILVPDSCWEAERNGSSISTDFKDDTIKNDENNTYFCSY